MRKKPFTRLPALLLAVMLPLGVVAQETAETISPGIERIERAIHGSAGYLIKNTRKNGMFNYAVNIDPEVAMPERYNILRHSGTVYAMARKHEVLPDKYTEQVVRVSGQYLLDHAVYPVPGHEDLLAVWSKPEVNNTRTPLQAKLGGTGLGLIALVSMEKMYPGSVPKETLARLGRFIIFMQKDDGSFYSKYIVLEGGRNDEWTSLYYPGEAALGLLMLYEVDPSPEWLNAAARSIAYLARSRAGSSDVPPDHWALLASEKLLENMGDEAVPVRREDVIHHVAQVCEVMVAGQGDAGPESVYHGSFDRLGRTTSTATRMEGLLAALNSLPPAHPVHERVRGTIDGGMAFLLRAQIKRGNYTGGMPRAIAKLPLEARGSDEFNRIAGEIRIDYVQHAMSAMIQYSELLEREKPGDGE